MDQRRSMKRTWIVAAIIILIAAFLLGFVPQFRRASQLQEEVRLRDQRIQELQREASLAKVRETASSLYIELTRKNYGLAAQHAAALFNHIGTVLKETSDPKIKSGLENILGEKDSTLTNIAKMDGAAELSAGKILEQIRQLTMQ
jgi:hypothetical protein